MRERIIAVEQKKIHHALGIDFGTSNSYLSDVRVGGQDLSYTDLKLHDGQSSIPTCVLYQKNPHATDTNTSGPKDAWQESTTLWEPCAFGEAAITLWKDLHTEERAHYRFRGGFKPDIAFDEQAYRDAVCFFRCLREYLQEQRILTHFSPDSGRQVVVGIPARHVAGQESKTLAALEEAGIPGALLVPEPVGALFYHLYYDRDLISVERAHRGVLVVDFGGGTFDVALLKDGDVQNCWGNPMLGGRLFDDLFYQWFLEQQGAQVREAMLQDGTLSYLRTFGFRRLKERFSAAWSSQQLNRFRERITVGADFDYGVFRHAQEDEFIQRARHYRASEDLLLDLKLLDDHSTPWLHQGPIDLLAEIQQQIELEQQTSHHQNPSVSTVILTGGSCRWPFVMNMAQTCFPNATVFQSPDPEATISRGLALSYAFREYSRDVGSSLLEHRTELRTILLDVIFDHYTMFTKRVSQQWTRELYTECIQPIFSRWKETGGSIAILEEETRKATESYFATRGQSVVTEEQRIFQEHVDTAVNDSLVSWLQKHRITRVEYLSINPLSPIQQDDLAWDTGFRDLMRDFFVATRWIIAGLVSVVTASLLGGGGVALVMTGPIGWLLGLALGMAASLAVLARVEPRQIHIPSWLLHRLVSDDRLAETQQKFQQELEENLLESFQNQRADLERELVAKVTSSLEHMAQHIPVTAVIPS